MEIFIDGKSRKSTQRNFKTAQEIKKVYISMENCKFYRREQKIHDDNKHLKLGAEIYLLSILIRYLN